MKYSLRTSGEALPKEFSAFSETVGNLLSSRGVRTMKDAEAFFFPDFDKHSHDPFLMKDMDRVVERVYMAVKNSEKTIIFSDYDADGIDGAVALHDLFRKIGYK